MKIITCVQQQIAKWTAAITMQRADHRRARVGTSSPPSSECKILPAAGLAMELLQGAVGWQEGTGHHPARLHCAQTSDILLRQMPVTNTGGDLALFLTPSAPVCLPVLANLLLRT